MSRTLATNTTVGDTTYAAGTVPPPEVTDLIDNPKAWRAEPPVASDAVVEQIAEVIPGGTPFGNDVDPDDGNDVDPDDDPDDDTDELE